jgi:hypothetical protein
MLRVDCYRFFDLGQKIHPFTTMVDETLVKDIWFDIYAAKNILNDFFQTFPLRISRDPATKLFQLFSKIVPDEITETDMGTAETGWADIGYRGFGIRQAATNLETVLAAELNNFDTYFVSQKGSFSTPDLIERAEVMLPESVYVHLSPNALEDFRQAGRCLAFNLGTAAAFHIARSTEDVIRAYYTLIVGTMPGVKMRSWGTYHKNLSKCGNASKKVLGWLDHIKDEYRNPVLHPEEPVSPDAALVFINACSSLIIMMVSEMVKLKKDAAQQEPEAEHDADLEAITQSFTAELGRIRPGNEEDTQRLQGRASEATGSGEEGQI